MARKSLAPMYKIPTNIALLLIFFFNPCIFPNKVCLLVCLSYGSEWFRSLGIIEYTRKYFTQVK